MGLVICVDCGGNVSGEAHSCPHCGKPAPVDAATIKARRKEFERREADRQRQAAKRQALLKTAQGNLKKIRFALPIAVCALAVVTVAICIPVWFLWGIGRIGGHSNHILADIWNYNGFGFLLLFYVGISFYPPLACGLLNFANMRSGASPGRLPTMLGLAAAVAAAILGILPLPIAILSIGSFSMLQLVVFFLGIMALATSLVCLVLTSLSFRNKIFGYVAIPLVILNLLCAVFGHAYGIMGILTYLLTFAPYILFSVAIMLDEKNRLKETTRH